jgi:hypothetical protein
MSRELRFVSAANGRWKDVLSPTEIALADEAAGKYLTPDCAHWLMTGELPDREGLNGKPRHRMAEEDARDCFLLLRFDALERV